MSTGKKVAAWSAITILASSLFAGLSAVDTSTVSAATTKPVKITFWHAMAGPYKEALQKRIDAFNKSQKQYKVVATAQGDYTTLNQKIMAGAKSKTLPVMAQATYTQIPDYAKDGIVTSIQAQVTGKNGLSKKQLNNIYSGFLQQSKYKGEYYSTPFSASVREMFYNKTLLKKYNLSVPKTWDDIANMSEVLKKDGIATVGFDKSFDMEWDSMVRSAGESLVTSGGKVNVNSKKAVAAAKLITNMVSDGTAKTAGSDIYGTTNFVNGKTALTFSSSAGITATQAAAAKDFDWGTAPLPSYQGKSATVLAGNSLVVTATASKKQQSGAWAFMKFLMSDKQTEKWAEATGYLPITKTATKSAAYKAYLDKNPLAKAASESLPGAFSDTAFLGYQDYRTNLATAVDAMLTKNTSASDALNTLADQTKKTLQENK
ncbi:ABC transporter substrate-binding protein [Leuconostoc suionicum]|uniref:ABC transporter substrate-binding protein n=1 Tax=Leuconostoc suionicum TaxID=1511761 RepID=UPI001B8B5682|nr:ABC transporter substrate-binding protein [Leuconostoc suionicum]MBS1008260.1 ABC transporter substrate-binding protein [Leuconostoc suionicum]